MKNFFLRNLQGKKILLLFILTTVIYLVMITLTLPKVSAYAGGMKLLDLLPLGYNNDYVLKLMTALGEDGRNAYLFYQIPLDLIYPALFAITYSLIFAYFLNRINKLNSTYFYLCYLPVIAGVFDYFENFGIAYMLISYPENNPALNLITSVFSVIKSISTTCYYIALIILLLLFGVLKGRQSVTQDDHKA